MIEVSPPKGRRAGINLIKLSSLLLALLLAPSCGTRVGTTPAGNMTSQVLSATSATHGRQSYFQARADGSVESPRVMFIGDSLLGGSYASEKDKTWSSLVESRIQSETGVAYLLPAPRKTLPPGTRTSTSSFDLSSIPSDLGLAIVELGTNDVSENLNLDTFAAQYSAILDAIKDKSPDSYLLCLSTWRPVASYNMIISANCTSRTHATYVDIGHIYYQAGSRGPAGLSTPLGPSDDFHPNDAGHEAIAESILAALT